MHLHHNLISAVSVLLSFLLLWIPFKILCAQFVGRSNLADVGFGIL